MIRLAAHVVARLAASVSRRYIERYADDALDIFVRTAILEGAAGVRPNQWTSRGRDGLDAAVRHLGIHENSLWTMRRNSGMYDSFVRAATAMLGRSDMADVADDLVSRVLSGETLPGRPGGELYAVGQQLADHIGGKKGDGMDGFGAARALVLRHVKQRALNEIRGRTREQARLGPTIQEGQMDDEGRAEQLPGSTEWSSYAGDLALDRFLSGPAGDRARAWLMDLWSRELRDSDMAVVRAWMNDPSKNYTQLSREIGVTNSFIGKAIVRAREVAFEAIRQDPPDFLRDLSLSEELEGLGMSVRRASTHVTPDQMHVSYPDPRTVRLMVYTSGSGTYSGFVEARVGPNQVAELVRQLKWAGLDVDPDDVETAIEQA